MARHHQHSIAKAAARCQTRQQSVPIEYVRNWARFAKPKFIVLLAVYEN